MYENRDEAGRLLAEELGKRSWNRPLVIALPRGGLPVAVPVARTLSAPLELLVVRKIGAPGNPEYGIGAITEDFSSWINPHVVRAMDLSDEELSTAILREGREVERRVQKFRGGRPLVEVAGRDVILVDDGLATGVTARVGARYLRKHGARRITLAVPVCARESASELSEEVDQVICLQAPEYFAAVGLWYRDFKQLEDEDVIEILRNWRERRPENRLLDLSIPVRTGLNLRGDLAIPDSPLGAVIFAHGSGSSRKSPRNIQVARSLNEQGIATLLFDLLTEAEARDRSKVFDINLLSQRLLLAHRTLRRWLKKQSLTNLPIGFFGASTGSAAALGAAADLGDEISAVVSRGGRPDLALERLSEVTAPTLLLVGGWDDEVIALNEIALKRLRAGQLRIIPGATHLFEEPGTLEKVAEEAAEWFRASFEESVSSTKLRKAA